MNHNVELKNILNGKAQKNLRLQNVSCSCYTL